MQANSEKQKTIISKEKGTVYVQQFHKTTYIHN